MDRPEPRLGTESRTLGQRAGAIVLDSLLLGVCFGVLSAVVAAAAFLLAPDPTGAAAVNVAVLGLWLLTAVSGLAYVVYFEGAHGQTLGKRAVGIVVVDEDGDPIGYADALVRNVLRVVDVLPMAYLLGAALVMVTERGQRVGDLAAETIVVETK